MKETTKAMRDAKKFGLGIIDQETGKRINPETLAFFWTGKQKMKLQKEVVLQRNFAVIKKVYKEKFGKKCSNPYCLELFKEDIGLFVERLIRAVEICTMGYVLNDGNGTLNLNKCSTIVKGRKGFLWEH
ncbi:hypothetical protein LCGC14_2077000 [marine sediment metagenome]|uniref:Uncharacterized protein n=1 Tax=marine sediment metagenome TaxID=412755 RepID=A0A0F9F429_9ZZZZ